MIYIFILESPLELTTAPMDENNIDGKECVVLFNMQRIFVWELKRDHQGSIIKACEKAKCLSEASGPQHFSDLFAWPPDMYSLV